MAKVSFSNLSLFAETAVLIWRCRQKEKRKAAEKAERNFFALLREKGGIKVGSTWREASWTVSGSRHGKLILGGVDFRSSARLNSTKTLVTML